MPPRVNCATTWPCSAARRYQNTASPASCVRPRPSSYIPARTTCATTEPSSAARWSHRIASAWPCSAARRYQNTASPASCVRPRPESYMSARPACASTEPCCAARWYHHLAGFAPIVPTGSCSAPRPSHRTASIASGATPSPAAFNPLMMTAASAEPCSAVRWTHHIARRSPRTTAVWNPRSASTSSCATPRPAAYVEPRVTCASA